MRRTLLALTIALLCGCGGKTEATEDTTSDASAADASQDSAAEAAAPDALPDSSSWTDCFGADGTLADWSIKACKGAGSCLVKEHQVNCCGTMVWMGVAGADEARFDACEALWRAHLPECGCAAEATKTEQPKEAVAIIADVDVGCMNCTMDSCVCMTFPK